LACLAIAGGGQASASPGCDNVNAVGTFGPAIAVSAPGAFAAGDTVVLTSAAAGGFIVLFDADGLYFNNAFTPATLSYTYTSATPSDQWDFGHNVAGPATASCIPAGGAGNGNADSQKLRALQIAATNTVATNSGAAITNAIDGGINDAFSPNGTPTNFGPTGGFINFAAEPKSDIASRTDEAFSALGYAGGINKAPAFNKTPPRLDRDWSAWADIRYAGWAVNDTTGTGNNLTGGQVNLTTGLGRKLNTDTLVGVVVGYEYFRYDVAALAGSLKGNGETIGGYFSRHFAGNLRFDAALGWTYLNYNATAGTASGSFNGSRWLASTGLTGTYKVNVYTIEPSAKVYALWESENAWTDSLGTAQASRNFSAGRTALGAKIGRSFEASNGWTVTPNAGLYGDWRFQTDNALPTGTPVANIGTGWSGRVTAGLAAKAARGCMVSLDGEYGGLGANYKIWTGNVRASIPF
jgi:hypothetical protein